MYSLVGVILDLHGLPDPTMVLVTLCASDHEVVLPLALVRDGRLDLFLVDLWLDACTHSVSCFCFHVEGSSCFTDIGLT